LLTISTNIKHVFIIIEYKNNKLEFFYKIKMTKKKI